MNTNILPDGRKAVRIRCHIRGSLKFMNQIIKVRITDISTMGLALELTEWIEARPGSTVSIQSGELGSIEGTVRWYRAGNMGIQIEETSNTAAQIEAYFKNFHEHQRMLKAG